MDDANKHYKVSFSGQVLPGYAFNEVRDKVTQALNLSVVASERLFQQENKPIIIKRLDSLKKANDYCKKLNRLGMLLDIEELDNLPVNKQDNRQNLPPTVVNQNIVPDKVVLNTVQDQTHRVYETVEVVEPKSNLVRGLLYSKMALFLSILGFVLCILYQPYPDGFLRIGFIVGSVLLFIGYKMFRSRV